MTQHSPYHETDTLAATEVADSAAFSAASVITGELAATEGVGCTDPVVLASMDRLLQSLTSQTKPRKRHPATDIRRIEAATGKIVIGVTIGDDGRVTSYTFAGAPAAETNLFEAEADEVLEQWKRKKNADQS
jgi:hypothetical protein